VGHEPVFDRKISKNLGFRYTKAYRIQHLKEDYKFFLIGHFRNAFFGTSCSEVWVRGVCESWEFPE
jgi:hypothetical protein